MGSGWLVGFIAGGFLGDGLVLCLGLVRVVCRGRKGGGGVKSGKGKMKKRVPVSPISQ